MYLCETLWTNEDYKYVLMMHIWLHAPSCAWWRLIVDSLAFVKVNDLKCELLWKIMNQWKLQIHFDEVYLTVHTPLYA